MARAATARTCFRAECFRAQAVLSGALDGPREYAGDPISMEFQNADLRSVLRTFAEISGLNLVIDPQVAGAVDVALVDGTVGSGVRGHPARQPAGIRSRRRRRTHSPSGCSGRRRTRSGAPAAEQQALAGELVVLTRALGYGRANELAELVTRTVLSQRGQVQMDGRTNMLVIVDLQDRVNAAQELLDALDLPQPQVEIQARIVQASQDYLREIGVQWGIAGRVAPEIGNTTSLAFPNRGGISGRVGGAQGPADGADPRALETENSGTAVNLGAPAASSALGLALGAIDGSLNLDVVLSAAESDGHVRILSNPRITTQNNVEGHRHAGAIRFRSRPSPTTP